MAYYTEEQRQQLVRAWLDKAQDEGRLVADPMASATATAVHALYQEMNPDHPMSAPAFGVTVNQWIQGSVRGPGGRWIRPGIRVRNKV